MKNILVLNGAARKNGNTAKLLAAFTDGAKSKGHNIEEFYLQTMDIHGCVGCNNCKKSAKGSDNPCVQNDDMVNIYKAFYNADVIVFASPIYWWDITGTLKTATDRLYALISSLGFKDFERESVLISTAGGPDYSNVINWYERFENFMGWTNRGVVLGSGNEGEARSLGISI